MEPNSRQRTGPLEYFRFVLTRIDRKVFGKASAIVALRSGTKPEGLFRDPVRYFHSKRFLEDQKGWIPGSKTDYLIPDHDFFLVHPVPFRKTVEDFQKKDPDFAAWTVKSLLTEMALNRMWQKFQMRQEVLFRTGRIGAMAPVSGEAIMRSMEPLDDLGIRSEEKFLGEPPEGGGDEGDQRLRMVLDIGSDEAITRAIEERKEHFREMPEVANLRGEELEVVLRRESEFDIVRLIARHHFAASEKCAVRFLRRLMEAVEPRTLRASVDG